MNEESFIARLVSKLFEPSFVFLAVALIGGWHVRLRGISYALYVLYLVVIGVLMTTARVRLVRVMHTNWDVSNRPKRVRLLVLLLSFGFFLFWSTQLWHNQALTRLFEFFLLWLLGFFIITLRMKISGHVAVFVCTLGLLARWYEFSLWSLAVIVPILGWSRLRLKRHTIWEVIFGAAYSFGMISVFDRMVR